VDFRRNIVVEEVFVDMLRLVEQVDTFDIVVAVVVELGERVVDRLVEVHKIVEVEVEVDFESALIQQRSILWDIVLWVGSTDTLA
jgi:hypothetical protein